MSEEEAKKRGTTPLARIVAFGQAGLDPRYMGMGGGAAMEVVVSKIQFQIWERISKFSKSNLNFQLKKAGWTKDEVDLYELNEANAAISLSVNKELKVDQSKVNIHGGSIALGKNFIF